MASLSSSGLEWTILTLFFTWVHKAQILTGIPQINSRSMKRIYPWGTGHAALWSVECGVCIEQYTVWSVQYTLWILECEVWIWSVECALNITEQYSLWVLWSALQQLGNMSCTEVLLYPTHICLSPSLDSPKITTEQHCTKLPTKKKKIAFILFSYLSWPCCFLIRETKKHPW